MAKKLIFIHGRNTKPLENELRNIWYAAVRGGLKRDFGAQAVSAFNSVAKKFVYYGDLSNKFLHKEKGVKIPDDVASRKETLKQLKTYATNEFRKGVYNKLEGKDALKEGLADTFSGILSALRIGEPLVSAVAPDMGHYWNREQYFGSDVRYRLTKVLKQAFDHDDQIMLVAHSLGTIVSYDCLWKFSHYGEYRHDYGSQKKIDLLVTMGSPLGDENVKDNLKGSSSKGKLRYPNNIKEWVNISAEDDYISHDSRLKNDYKDMVKYRLLKKNVREIYPIYNLAVRNNKSNPHSSVGYLIHPKFTELLWNWISG